MRAVWVLGAFAGAIAACSLNPQPLPPLTGGEDQSPPGADASTPATGGGGTPDASTAHDGGTLPHDAGAADAPPEPPPADAGEDADADDGGAEDGAVDASDGGEDAGDATTD